MSQSSQSSWNLPLLCPGRYDDRVCIVTGGVSGIGEAAVVRMLREGGNVVAADIDHEVGRRFMDVVHQHGFAERARFKTCDVTNEQDVADLLTFTEREFGRLDVMVNCAGAGGAVGTFTDTSTESWDDTFTLLSRSGFIGTKLAAKMMIRLNTPGVVINVASISALLPGCAGAAYAAAKAAMVNYTKMAAMQLGKFGIRCNVLCPGTIITPLLVKRNKYSSNIIERVFANSQPWPDPGMPEQVAGSILFLGSDQASFISGATLWIDGGLKAGGPILCEWQDFESIIEQNA